MSSRRLVIPLFIPHQGCSHHCLFCNQHRISGAGLPNAAAVRQGIEEWLSYAGPERRTVQVAFYGGSFTGLSLSQQRALLAPVQPFLDQGLVHSIRCSTRPDLLDDERIALLREHRVDLVELGVQVMDDSILALNRRGHTVAQVEAAVDRLTAGGIEAGIQLMIGLPGQRFVHVRRTVAAVCRLNPACVRIYPVLVVEGSPLAQWYRQGRYQPLSLARAILLAAWMKKRFDAAAIPVIRLGLQPSDALAASVLAGPYHPAFGQLVASRLMFRQTRHLLASVHPERKVRLLIAKQDQSTFLGQARENHRRLATLGLTDRFTLAVAETVPRHHVLLDRRQE